MVFDDEQKRRDTGESMAEDESRKDDRRSSAGRAAASAGAGGAGLGAGAAAGIVAGDDAVELIQDQLEDTAEASLSEIEAARARVAAAEDAAREASFDVFESRVAEVSEDLPAGITDAASIIGDALPPVPGGQEDGQQPDVDAPGGQPPVGRPDPDNIVPVDGEAPEPGDAPLEGQEPPAAPDIDGGPGGEGDDAPPPPSGAAPDFPAPPAAPDGPAPPSAPSPPAPGGDFGQDEVVDEAPAPPAGPAASGSSDDGAAVAPPVAEAPAPAGPGASDEAPAAPDFSEDVEPPITDRPDVPEGSSSDPGSSSSDGPSGEPAPPVASEPDAPDAPGGSTEAPPAPGGSGSSSTGDDQAPPPPSGEPGASAPDSGSGQSVDYPYVYRWDDDGDWVDVAMQNDHGEVYYLRYYDDGSVFYLNEHGHYQQIEGDNLPQLLYVGDDGVAYFSKMQHHHTVYFSMDPHGNVEWVDYDDIPGYEPPVYDDDYEYPRVAEYEYGDEPWALVEMEDGRLIKYYQDGGAYLVDEHGNETAISGFQIPSLLYVDHDGDAYFRVFLENEGVYRYYTIDVDGGVEYIHAEDVPGYVEEEPVYDEHPPYFFDDYPNPFYGDLEPDGEPSFANGVYTQSYNDGQVVVTWFQEGGPYRIRYYSEDNAGGDLLLDLTYDAYNYEIDEVHYLYEEDVEDELYPPYGMPPIMEFGDREYVDPEDAGYELIGAIPADEPTQWQFIGPNGERVIVSKIDEYTYQYVFAPDPNVPVGQWEMVMNVTTDEHGNYVSYEAVEGTYYDEWYEDNQPVEEYYDAEWAEHYEPHFGFEHPFDIYGQPDPPGEYQAPNVYAFGGGRAIVVRNEDGSETITWYSEDGSYIEYKATVSYDGAQWVTESEALPTDLIPVFGILPVEGTPVYDPYHVDAPWGEPDSVSILEDRVIARWETDEGVIQSIWYRDGSHYREVRYPDGLVISGNGSDPWEYDVPDDWTPPDYDGAEPVEFEADGYLPDGAPDYFGEEIWVNPETDERFEFYLEGHPEPGVVTRTYRADLDGDGTHDYQIVVIERADGSISVDYRNMETGENEARVNVTQDAYGNYSGYFELHQYVDDPQGVPPVDIVDEEPEWDAQDVYDLMPDYLPAEFEGGFPNPEHADEYEYHHSAMYGSTQLHFFSYGDQTVTFQENPNGTMSMYWYDRPVEEFGPADINDVQAHAFIWGEGQIDMHYYEDGVEVDGPPGQEPPEDQNVVGPEAEIFDAIPDNLPAFFEEERFPNPEGSEDYTYHSSDGDVHFFVSEDGSSTIRVWTNPNGNVTMAWHDAPPGEINESSQELVVEIQANGDWETTYYSEPPPQEEVPEFEADGYLPEGAPDYFGNEMWTNPETDERFEFQFQGNPESGVVTRTYRADLDGDGDHDYQVVVTERADGTVYVDYRNMETGENEARAEVQQDAYGNYVGFGVEYYVQDPQGAAPYEEPVEEPEEDYLPDWLPESFDGWPSPVQEGFEYQYTGSGDGNQNHFYSNGQYTIMVTDYGDGTGRVLIDDLSNGQGWDTGYDLHDYGQYEIMDAYVPEEPEPEPEDEYLPDWLPESFDGWPSPVQEGFEYQYTGTGGGYENHFYSNGQYTIMVTDYGDGTGRVLIDDLSNGQGWDTGYDLYDYGQYSVMDAYAPEQTDVVFDQVEEVDPQRSVAPEDLEEIPEEPEPVPDPAPVVQEATSDQEVQQIEAAGGNAEIAEPLEFNDPEIETEAVEASVSPEEVPVETEFAQQATPVEAVVETQAEETALQIDEEDLLVPEDLDDDGTGF